jgi:hypothetical protein
VTNDWQNAEAQNLRMYRGFMRLAMVSTVLIAIGLVIIASITL